MLTKDIRQIALEKVDIDNFFRNNREALENFVLPPEYRLGPPPPPDVTSGPVLTSPFGSLKLPYHPSEGITISSGSNISTDSDSGISTMKGALPTKISIEYIEHKGDRISIPSNTINMLYTLSQPLDFGSGSEPPIIYAYIPGVAYGEIPFYLDTWSAKGVYYTAEDIVAAQFSISLTEWLSPEVVPEEESTESTLPSEEEESTTFAPESG